MSTSLESGKSAHTNAAQSGVCMKAVIAAVVAGAVGIGAGVGIGIAVSGDDSSPSSSATATVASPPPPPPASANPGLTYLTANPNVMSTIINYVDPKLQPNFDTAVLANFHPIGYHTAHICEATDIAYSSGSTTPVDGESGDTAYPFGTIKVLATVGEYYPPTGYMLVGVPDGMGAYLKDATTVRIVMQSESYGPMYYESYSWLTSTGATFTGSHVMYIDYDRDKLAAFMSNSDSAEGMVKGAGNVHTKVYNLKGNLVDPRASSGCTANPHYSNTDPDGCGEWTGIMDVVAPTQADWLMQSLCSAHLEEKHQWGAGIGVEDDLFITNEEWTSFVAGSNYTGIPGHVIDLKTFEMYATGVFTLGGFEKIVEVNCGHTDYVCFSPSGYNGAFGSVSGDAAIKNKVSGNRPDGSPWVWPQNIVPARLYIGKKGFNAQGQAATDFLSKNGLAYGKLYGFGTSDAAAKASRDTWHKTTANPGDQVVGALYQIAWTWDGEVKWFMDDGSWDFQTYPDASDTAVQFWNANGNDAGGSKTEHNSPDPYGGARFMQTSTAGYFGIYDFPTVTTLLASGFPAKIPCTYTALQGEKDITAQIKLGGKGKKANGQDQTTMSDKYSVASDGTVTDSAKVTFEDIDGFEWIAASGTTDGYVIIQEDGSNDFGERTFISKVMTDGTPMDFYFIAMSGGDDNTRMKANVAVPKGSAGAATSHEFSGIIDLSGMLAKDANGAYMVSGNGAGPAKRTAEAAVAINDKIIAFGLQAHSINKGIVEALRGDRGGQLYAYKPSGIP